MPGYPIDTLSQIQAQPWGTSVFNGIVSGPTVNGLVTLQEYPDENGPSRTVNSTLPIGVTRAAAFPAGGSAITSITGISWQRAGDLAIYAVTPSAAADLPSAVSSTRVGGWTQVGNFVSGTIAIAIWVGTVISAGADTITVTWTPANPASVSWIVDSLTSALPNPAWSVVASSSLNTASGTSFNYPSLTSGAVIPEAYWGWAVSLATSATAGTTPGFGYLSGGQQLVALNGALTTAAAYQPNGTQASSAQALAAGAIVSVVSSASSLAGQSRVQIIPSTPLVGVARLQASPSSGQPGTARIRSIRTTTQAGHAYLQRIFTRTQAGTARILTKFDKLYDTFFGTSPWSFVGTNGATGAGPSAMLIPAVAATQVGDIMIIVAACSSISGLSPPSGWTAADSASGTQSTNHKAISCYKVAASGDNAGSFSITLAGSQFASARLFVLRGNDTSAPVNNHSVRHDAAAYVASVPAAALTVSDPHDATVYFYTGINSNGFGATTMTVPSTLANTANASNGNDGDVIGVGWGQGITAPGNANTSPGIDYVCFGFDLKPVSISTNPALWSNTAPAQITINSAQLQIASTTSAAEYSLITQLTYDLTASQVAIQLPSAGNQATASWEVYPLYLQDSGGTNKLFWYVNQGVLRAYKTVASTQTQVFSATYNSSTHAWLRIRESGGTTFWEYSADTLSWTTAWSEADPIVETALLLYIQAGQFAIEASTTTALFDNLNALPKTASQAGTARIRRTFTSTLAGHANISLGGATRTATQAGVARIYRLSPYDVAILADSPMSYWPLTEASGAVAADLVDGNTGSFIGTYALGATGPITADTVSNGALDLSGGAGAMNVPSRSPMPNFEFDNATAYTIEIWVKAASASPGTFKYLFSTNNSGGSTGYLLSTDGSSTLRFGMAGAPSTTLWVASEGSTTWNTAWHLYHGRFNGTTVDLYRDAVWLGGQPISPDTAQKGEPSLPLRIGDFCDDTGISANVLAGYYARGAIYPTALSPTQMAAHLAAATPTRTAAQAGQSRIQASRSSTQPGQSRIQVSLTSGQPGRSRLSAQRTSAQAGVARLAAVALSAQSGRSRLSAQRTLTVTGRSRVQATLTAAVAGRARVQATLASAISGRSRLSAQEATTTRGTARLSRTFPSTQAGQSRLSAQRTSLQSGTSRLLATRTLTIAGRSRIQRTLTSTQPGQSRLSVQRTSAQVARANIVVAGVRTLGQPGVARLAAQRTSTQPGTARIQRTLASLQAGRSRLSAQETSAQAGRARISAQETSAQNGRSRLSLARQVALAGVARLQLSRQAAASGQARLLALRALVEPGTSRLVATRLASEAGVARLQLSRSAAQAGRARISRGFSSAQAGRSHVNSPLKAIIPLYVYPSTGGASGDWATVVANPPFAIIANPATGPGLSADANYTSAIAAIRAAGIKVLGYVNASYGSRSLGTSSDTAASGTMYGDINGWTANYTVDGYFFDLTLTDAGADLTWTQSVASYARSHLSGAFVMCNPGAYPLIHDYIDLADTVSVWEGTYGSYDNFAIPSYTGGYEQGYDRSRMAHLVYQVPAEPQARLTMCTAVRANVGFFFASNDAAGLWSALPSYWPSEYTDLLNASFDCSGWQLQTGQSRITRALTSTQAGHARLVVSGQPTNFQSGRSRIVATESLTTRGTARLQRTLTATIAGRSRIVATGTAAQAGRARLTRAVLVTVTGTARLQRSFTSTQPGQSRFSAQRTSAQAGHANIVVAGVRTLSQPGTARLVATRLATQPGRSRVQAQLSASVAGTARIAATRLALQPGQSRILRSLSSTTAGQSRLAAARSLQLAGHAFVAVAGVQQRSQPGQSRILQSLSRAQPGAARLQRSFTAPEPGRSRIQASPAQAIAGVARLVATRTALQPGQSRIARSFASTIAGRSRLAVVRSVPLAGRSTIVVAGQQTRLQPGTARLVAQVSAAQPGRARIARSFQAALSGRSTLQVVYTRSQTGTARLVAIRLALQPGTARLARTLAVAQAGRARLAPSRSSTTAGLARILVLPQAAQSGRARVLATRTAAQPGSARVIQSRALTTAGRARIAASFAQLQPGQSRIRNTGLRSALPGTARILSFGTLFRTQVGQARIAQVYARSQAGQARLAVARTTAAQPGHARILISAQRWGRPGAPGQSREGLQGPPPAGREGVPGPAPGWREDRPGPAPGWREDRQGPTAAWRGGPR